MRTNLTALLVIVCLCTTGCIALVGKTIHRIRTSDDVVLVKQPKPVLFRRLVKKGKFTRSAPDSLLAMKTGWLTIANPKVRAKEVVVYGNLEQAEKSGEQFELDKTVIDWLKKHSKGKKMAKRMEKRDMEDRKWGHILTLQ